MNDLLTKWQEWQKRHNKYDSVLQMYSDGSGTFDEKDLYGPSHEFYSVDQLMEILSK